MQHVSVIEIIVKLGVGPLFGFSLYRFLMWNHRRRTRKLINGWREK